MRLHWCVTRIAFNNIKHYSAVLIKSIEAIERMNLRRLNVNALNKYTPNKRSNLADTQHENMNISNPLTIFPPITWSIRSAFSVPNHKTVHHRRFVTNNFWALGNAIRKLYASWLNSLSSASLLRTSQTGRVEYPQEVVLFYFGLIQR